MTVASKGQLLLLIKTNQNQRMTAWVGNRQFLFPYAPLRVNGLLPAKSGHSHHLAVTNKIGCSIQKNKKTQTRSINHSLIYRGGAIVPFS